MNCINRRSLPMRVISGTARGMRLTTLEGLDVRPTTDKVKESLFNIIQFDIEGRRVLDLFAGSGQLGIEALSRGAEHATFVDRSPKSVSVVRKNLEHTKLVPLATVRQEESNTFLLKTRDTFDLAFLDPPYGRGLIDAVLPELVEHMSDYGIIVCETSRDESLPETVGDFYAAKTYRYGKIQLTLYRRKEDET
ncbi:MAG: 16S rRNA (guanine(966)-N(2))-methyltransferase RsmD [Acutalibacteraceae bacterium]|nr:16S rRNA (guanine(966)-N(2))-methyltransferase RsmD [Acutalibacteraceae bacterium]